MDQAKENALTRAWDFLEHWKDALSRSDGADRLDEFYPAMIEFIRRENIAERISFQMLDGYDQRKIVP
jgi:hypothetical protein